MKVEYQPKDSEILSVIVNGECNHADCTVEEVDFGSAVYRNGELDYEDDWRQVISCTKCKAWRYTLEDDWVGIEYYPEPYIFNNGKLVLR